MVRLRHQISLVIAIVCVLIVSARSSAAEPLSMRGQFVPATLKSGETSTLLVTLSSDTDLLNSELVVRAPAGFTVIPATAKLSMAKGSTVSSFQVSGNEFSSGDKAFVVELKTNGAAVTATTISVAAKHSISAVHYFLFGILGIIAGWFVRTLANLFIKYQPLPAADAAEEEESRLAKFAKKHFGVVDFATSVVLGTTALLLLAANGLPETGTTRLGAVAIGIGLGVLANNDLLAKVRKQ